MHTPLKTILFSLGSLCLVACTTLQVPNTPTQFKKQSWALRRAALMPLTQWTVSGAFSLKDPQKTTIAGYTWRQQRQTYHIRLHSALDLYSVDILGRPGFVTLSRNTRQHYTASTPEALMQQQLGWQLPITNLYYWLRGLPAPGLPATMTWDAYGHLQSLQQQGWQIYYNRYARVGALDLPQLMTLNQGEFHARIAMKQWWF